MRLFMSCLLLGIAAAIPAEASTVKQKNLEELAQRAERIFVGRVLSVNKGFEPRLNSPIWITIFETIRPIKGDIASEVVLRTVGSRIAGLYSPIVGTPSFANGGEFLIFLNGENSLGLSSVVGIAQGRMPIIRLPDGTRGVVGAFRPDALLGRMQSSPLQSKILRATRPAPRGTTAPEIASYDTLMEALDELVREPTR